MLAARQLGGVVIEPVTEPDRRQLRRRPLPRIRRPGQLHRHRDILLRGHRRQQVEGLEHDPDPAEQAVDLADGTRTREIYDDAVIHERHRHRYEFNCLYESALTGKGLEIVGRSLDGKFVEIIELPSHPWYVAVQFHPEFKSKPLKAHPLFAGFVEASHQHKVNVRRQAEASVAG